MSHDLPLELRRELVREARTYIGTPWHHQGRLKGVGLDCLGLFICIGMSHNLVWHDSGGYDRMPDGVMLLREIRKSMDEIQIKDAVSADALIFKFGREPWHVAMVTDIGIIHANGRGPKMVVEHSLNDYWTSRICNAFRVRQKGPA